MTRRACAALFIVATALGCPKRGRAQAWELQVEPTVGVDSNPGLAADPNARGRLAAVPTSLALGIGAELGLSWRHERLDAWLGADASGQWLSPGEGWGTGRVSTSVSRRLGARRLLAGLSLGGYGATFGLDNAGFVVGALALQRALGTVLITGTLDSRLRVYADGGQRDGRVGLHASLDASLGALRLQAGLALDRRQSNAVVARRWEASGRMGLIRSWPQWEFSAFVAAYYRAFEISERTGAEAELSLTAARALGVHQVFARCSVGVAGGRRDALQYARVVVLLGARLRASGQPPEPPQQQGPATASPGQVVFRVHAPGARSVSVLTSLLDWDEAAGALHRVDDDDDVFEGRFAAPAGRHAYRFMVDGVPVTPEDAPAYRDDGFGGRDAVVTVPE